MRGWRGGGQMRQERVGYRGVWVRSIGVSFKKAKIWESAIEHAAFERWVAEKVRQK